MTLHFFFSTQKKKKKPGNTLFGHLDVFFDPCLLHACIWDASCRRCHSFVRGCAFLSIAHMVKVEFYVSGKAVALSD